MASGGCPALPSAYRFVPDWPALPDGWELHDVPGVAVDARDRVFLFARHPRPVIALDAAGAFHGFWGQGRFTRPHAIAAAPDGALFLDDDAGCSPSACRAGPPTPGPSRTTTAR
jgi:hypothetical protein